MAPSFSVGFGNYKFEAKGLVAMLLATALAVIVGFLWVQVHVYNSLQKDIKGVQAELSVLTYVLSIPETQRPTLMMPAELRRRMMP